jgi:diacylglycerol kinase (ATP)
VIGVIFNPTAGGERATAFRRQLESLSGPVRLLPTRHAGDASALAAQAVADGFDTVVAAGGDGTVNEVVNGLAAPGQFPIPTRLGVLPLGTVNVFAKELNLPEAVAAGWEVIQRGHTRQVDLAWARHAGGQRWFIQMAGAGLDAQAIHLVNWQLKKAAGPLAYLWAGCQALMGPLPKIQVTGGPGTVRGKLALLGNGRFYGGRLPVFPAADLADGRLDLALLERVNPLSLARAAVATRAGRLTTLSGVIHQQSAHFRFEAEGHVPFQVEGDNIGHLPAEFGVQSLALGVVCPCPR